MTGKSTKLNIGDKIKYTDFDRVDKTCECCGHENYDLVEKQVEGIIEKTKQETIYNIANGFIVEDVEIKNGKKVITPRMMNMPEILEKETVYKVNGTWITEDSIIK